ncbi:dynein regulatory complex protein 9 [Drosophila tropicalis]|uniref:dynein regulatory complex protein 9 n=1 Tax=Drosophila tropicalis TaxID=46794 RepID=UPI0035ABDB2A
MSLQAQVDELRQVLLLYTYKDTLDKLVIQQRSQRLNLSKTMPSVPASLRRRRRSSSAGDQERPERVLLTGKTLPRLESLLGEGETDADLDLDEGILNSLKFERDMDALRAIFEAAIKEVTEPEQNMDALDRAIGALNGNSSGESQAMKELQSSKDELKNLKHELERVKQSGLDRLKDIDERTADAKYNLRCVSRVNDLEYNLVQRWEAGRITQAEIWGENAERAYLRDILNYKQRLAREERVSGELRAFRSGEIIELRRRIEEWQQRYVSELRRVDRESEAWELRILEQKKLLVRHREIYEERLAFVKDYQAKKAEEQRLHDLQVHRMECAIKLQAWWRGTMVRRGLGPFKKKPKRGKRGKAKK